MSDENFDSPDPSSQPQGSSSHPAGQPAGEGVSKDVLKSAFKAFKKRWKLTARSRIADSSAGPMSSGSSRQSSAFSP
jgi:hypothetical protein